ncbi:EF-hand domain-containing protein [Streptomyces sp. NPDC002889]|uniref:EF-hand domain-containing protein n=1 Tax=Streptomyces sp. NPDC002889 TaxID=3364669 RepID=UPI0036B64612
MATFDPITRRLRQLFAALDTDQDGFVTWGDYQRIVHKYMTGYALAGSDTRIRSLEKAYWAQWLGLLTQANPGQDRLSQDEFVAAHRAAGYDTYASHLLEDIAQSIFNVLDVDGDKRISRDEFARYLAFCEISGSDAAIIFQRLDLDRDAFISQREVARSLRAFHLYNDDLNTPGGIFLGVTEASSGTR